jgi:hypothetical protein
MTRHFRMAAMLLLELIHCFPIHGRPGIIPLTSLPGNYTERELQLSPGGDGKFSGKSTIFANKPKQSRQAADAIQHATQFQRGEIVQEDSGYYKYQMNQGHGNGHGHSQVSQHLRVGMYSPGDQGRISAIADGVEGIGVQTGRYSKLQSHYVLLSLFCFAGSKFG